MALAFREFESRRSPQTKAPSGVFFYIYFTFRHLLILQQLDSYITNRKETVRQNPDCSAGSLFALPTDDAAVTKAVKMVELLLKPVQA